MFGISEESFSASNLSKKGYVDIKVQYFTINFNSRNAGAIANTLTKHPTI